MRARMRSILGWFLRRPTGAGTSTRGAKKRAARFPSALDLLERREVLSTSATFVPFAAMAGQVATSGSTAQVTFHFPAGQITSSRLSTVLMGFYVETASGSASSAIPQITGATGPAGNQMQVVLPKRDHSSPSKSLFLTYLNATTTSAQDVTIDVKEPGNQTGGFVVEAFLPGDANVDGYVNASDITVVQSAYGTSLGQATNIPTADFNADGHVGCLDLRLTDINQGAHVLYGNTIAAASIPTPVIPTPIATPVVATPAVVAVPAVKAVTPVAIATTAPAVTTSTTTLPVATTTSSTTTTSAASTAAASAATGTSGSSAAAAAAAASAASTATSTTTTTASTTPAATVTTPATGLVPVIEEIPVITYVPASSTTTAVPTVASAASAIPTATASTLAPAYYYGQPVVQAPGTAQAAASAPAYYYGQPVPLAASGTSATATPMPVYYYTPATSTVPVAAASAAASLMPVYYLPATAAAAPAQVRPTA